MKPKYLLLILLCFLFLKTYPQEAQNAILKTFHSISSHDLLNDAAELSSAKYGGRLSGSQVTLPPRNGWPISSNKAESNQP
ncbi:MAG TPA: hypothetical protein DHV48_00025 [Prolixibacteraceae bacterium]|nr:hypothetical protein [Prolixibacteraceae bacterium]